MISFFATWLVAAVPVLANQQGLLSESSSSDASPFNAEFAKLATELLDEWHVPGISIGVVDGDKTWSKGYGMATLPATPADPSTLYMAGSTTKAFTAAVMSMLVDDNENYPHVQWSTPISELIREDFVLQDEYLTNHVTIEDALSHRTGVPRHDLSYGGPEDHRWSAKDFTRHLRYLPATAELRTTWQYNNMMYIAIGHVIETLTKSRLEDVIKSRILEPLKMDSTYMNTSKALHAPEHLANGYYYLNDSFYPAPNQDLTEVGGAGFIASNVIDYTKWIRSWLNKTPPISKTGHEALWTPRMLLEQVEKPYTGPIAYALGWITGTYKGYQFFTHNGGMESMGTTLVLFPELKYGVIGFANTADTSNQVEDILLGKLIDDKLKIPTEERFDWKNKYGPSPTKRTACLPDIDYYRFYPNAPSPKLPPSTSIASYTGTYFNAGYGNITFSEGKGTDYELFAIRNQTTWHTRIDLEHVTGDYFLAHGNFLRAPSLAAQSVAPAVFRLGVDGVPSTFGINIEPLMEEKIWFVRV